jgi:serine/threonine-protein phosphatase 2A regulatory subunit B''
VINMFFKQVLAKLSSKDPEAEKNFHVEDIKDEIFDMAKPQTPMGITLNDLVNCGQGDVIVSILTDAKAFFDYDQRELGNTLNIEDDGGDRQEFIGNETSTFGTSTKGAQGYNEV